MPDFRRRVCRECGRHMDDVGPLSWTGLCAEDGAKLLRENVIGLHTKTGEPLKRWRRGMAASVGAVLLDDYRDKP